MRPAGIEDCGSTTKKVSAECRILLMKSIAADCGAQLLVAGNVVVGVVAGRPVRQ